MAEDRRRDDRASIESALTTLTEAVGVIDRTETIPVEAASGRVIACPLRSERPIPHYRRATRDGYALRAAETVGASSTDPVRLSETPGEEMDGQALPINTGGAVPPGADAVVMDEDVETDDRGVIVTEPVDAGDFVVPVGADIEAADPLFRAGHRLRPGDLGLLRLAGLSSVEVRSRPIVAVLPTGEELVTEQPGPGEVIETNGLVLSRLVERFGGVARYRPVVTDDPTALREAVERDRKADLIVTAGGSASGERDVLPAVIEEIGEYLIRGLAVRPGHTAGIASVPDTPLFSLPGTPIANLVLAWILLRPTLLAAQGRPLTNPPAETADLAQPLESEPGVLTVHGVQQVKTGPDRPVVREVSGHGLPQLRALEGWARVPPEEPSLSAGRAVEVEYWASADQSDADALKSSENADTR